MRITKRQLRRIIREAARSGVNTGAVVGPRRRRLISEVDTSADGSMNWEEEKPEVYMPGVAGGTYAYKHTYGTDLLDADDLSNDLNSDLLEDEPRNIEAFDYDEETFEEYKKAWERLEELGLDEWSMSDRKELSANILKAIEDVESAV